MSIRHTKNETTYQQKRNSGSGGIEKIAVTPTLITLANNTNIAGAVVTAGTAITYRGHEHIPVGTAQYDLNAV